MSKNDDCRFSRVLKPELADGDRLARIVVPEEAAG